MCGVQSQKLHTHSWLFIVHCAACCVVGEKLGGQGRSFWRVPGTYSQTETNSDGNVKQRCADCASEAEHSQKARLKKARMRWASQAAVYHILHNWPFQGYHFFKNKTICIFSMGVTIIQHISVFSYTNKMQSFATSFVSFALLLLCLSSLFRVFRRLLGNWTDRHFPIVTNRHETTNCSTLIGTRMSIYRYHFSTHLMADCRSTAIVIDVFCVGRGYCYDAATCQT